MSDTATDTGTDSVITTVVTTTSTSLTTSPTTTVTITDTSTSTPDVTTPTTTPPPSTITTSEPPSTTVVEPTTSPTPSVINVTATTTLTPSQQTTTTPDTASVLVVTSTQPGETSTTKTSTVSSDVTGSGSSSTPSALSASGTGSGSGGGLGSGAKIAIAVIIPIVVIAAAFLIGFFLWRKRKARKNNEELRKNEMAEYGFNPNSDPTLVAGVGAYTDNASEAQEDHSGGYRGWGATSSGRKASTTLGSNGRAAGGLAMSESSSQPGVTHGSPNAPSDAYSTDPLMNGHPESGDGVGALGAAAGVSRSRSGAAGVRRGPSNASSTYSEGHVSELSSDNQSVPGPYYQEEVPYNIYNDAAPSHGPYGDGSYGGSGNQPVIRDVQARRSARVERAPTFPQNQGGISQNF